MNSTIATLKLFNGVQIDNENFLYDIEYRKLERTIKNGYIIEPKIYPAIALTEDIEKIIGISGEKANTTFHKSWKVIRDTPIETLAVQQIVHYITTYGFEALGCYSNDTVYIPKEALNLPTDFSEIPLVVIRGLTVSQILEETLRLISSGVALSADTIECVKEIILWNKDKFEEELVNRGRFNEVKNREILSILYNLYNILPDEPVEFLRVVIERVTGETLLIKNDQLISKIKAGN
jgi:hypothetical protein